MNFDDSILVCGKIASGKSSLINYISNQFNIPIVSFGSMVKQKATDKDLKPIRKNFQDLGYELFKSLGPQKLLEQAIKYSKNENTQRIIFDGVRHESILSEIKKLSKKVLLIYLNANEDVRFPRYKKYSGLSDISLQVFHEMDNQPIELGTDSLETHADLIIDASQSFEKVCSLAGEKIQNFISQ